MIRPLKQVGLQPGQHDRPLVCQRLNRLPAALAPGQFRATPLPLQCWIPPVRAPGQDSHLRSQRPCPAHPPRRSAPRLRSSPGNLQSANCQLPTGERTRSIIGIVELMQGKGKAGPNTTEQGPARIYIDHPEGRVLVEEQRDGLRYVKVLPAAGTFVSRGECVTSYPLDLIRRIVEIKSPGYVCDEIARDEDPDYVELFLRYSLLAYVPPESFCGARLLDFGSGSAASTVVLSRMFPEAQIVGVELEPDLIMLAQMRAEHYGLENLTFLKSPDPGRLPDQLGVFSFINLGAVYEHLLPAERPRLLRQLWSILEPGGVFFVNQLPYRFYPMEPHTTGLPLLNYFPDRLAHKMATRYSPRIKAGTTWAELLRMGIRGGTAPSVRRDLLSGGGKANQVTPKFMGLHDHADLWYGYSSQARAHPIKRAMRIGFKVTSRLTGTPVAPGLSLAFQKLA